MTLISRRILPAIWMIYMAALGATLAGLQSPTLRVISLVLLVAGALYAAVTLARTHQKPPAALWPLLAWVIAQFVSMLAAGGISQGLPSVLVWTCIVLAFWASGVVGDEVLERAVFAVIASVALIALYQVLLWWVLSGFPLVAPLRPFSTLMNTNPVGAAMLIGMALAAKSRRWGWLITCLVVLVLTASRSAMLGLLAGAAVFVWLSGGLNRVSRRVVIGALIVTMILIPLAVFGFFFNSTHGTVAQRLELWSIAIRTFMAHPLTGAGPGGYKAAFLNLARLDHNQVEHSEAHNVFLQVAAEEGLLGLGVLGWLLTVCGIALARAYRHGREEEGGTRRVAALGIALMAALLVQGLADYVYIGVPFVLITLWAGRVILRRPEDAADAAPSPSPNRRWLAATIALGGVAFPFAAYLDAPSELSLWTTVLGFALACLLFMADFRYQTWDQLDFAHR